MVTDFFQQRPEIHPTIYAYSLVGVESHKGYLKVGFTERDVDTRVKEQLHTSGVPYQIHLRESAMCKDGSCFTDHDVHTILRKRGFRQLNAGEDRNEWFKGVSHMVNVLQSSAKTAPMPERAYDMARRPASVSRRSKQCRRRSPVLPILLGLLLFGGGFLLGKASVAILPEEILSGGDTPVTAVPVEEPTVPMEDITVPAEEIQAPAEGPAITQEPVIPEEPAVPAEAEAEWNLRLVSAAHPLPEDFTAPELTQLRNHQAIDKRAYPALQQMMDDARAAGLQPLICSSYRTRATQERLFQNKADALAKQGFSQEEAESLAAEWVARPSTSEHEAGLAVDNP